MKAVLNCVLSQDPIIREGTSDYINDIFVNEEIVEASRVEHHLNNFGLTSKRHERLVNRTRVSGLRVWGEQGGLAWRRDELSNVPPELMWGVVFSYCSKLVGHYPVCGWLRVVTAFIKRRANHITESWNEVICNEKL